METGTDERQLMNSAPHLASQMLGYPAGVGSGVPASQLANSSPSGYEQFDFSQLSPPGSGYVGGPVEAPHGLLADSVRDLGSSGVYGVGLESAVQHVTVPGPGPIAPLIHPTATHQQQRPQEANGRSAPMGGSAGNSAESTPNYEDMFPALPGGLGGDGGHTSTSPGSSPFNSSGVGMKPQTKCNSNSFAHSTNGSTGGFRPAVPISAVRSSTVTQLVRAKPEERRFRDSGAGRFGESEQQRVCADIMQRTGTRIEITSTRDGTFTFMVTGKDDAVQQAKKLIGLELLTQASRTLSVPREYYRFILGKGGKQLTSLEQSTGTKINLPRQHDQSSDLISITGPKEGIEAATEQIRRIAQEAASKSQDRLDIPKIYHPFILGPHGETLRTIQEETGARVHIPPANSENTELSITGTREAVVAARDRLLRIWQEKEKRSKTVSMEVKKDRHKYIIGQRGLTLQEIFRETGVWVEMPPPDSDQETIILRGDQEKLGPALTVCYNKAHSEVEEFIEVDQWIHKYILGPKGTRLEEIAGRHRFPKAHVSLRDDRITVSGAREEVTQLLDVIQLEVAAIRSRLSMREIGVDPKYHRFIIGKKGAHISAIRDQTGAQIHVPAEPGTGGTASASGGAHFASTNNSDQAADVIRVEGSPDAVHRAVLLIDEMVAKLVEEDKKVSRDVTIEPRFHRQLIGTKGETIRQIREKFNQVVIAFPEAGVTSNKVTIKGAEEDVEACAKHLNQLHKQMLEESFRLEVPIFKEFHKFIIGKEGATIRKIREETSTKIDLPLEESKSDKIVITGKKADVLKAERKIKELETELANITSLDIIIPAKLHNLLIGAKGRLVRAISDETGGVQIRFPEPKSGSEKVNIRGPKEAVAKAKAKLVELAGEKEKISFSAEIKAKPEHHRFLIGKHGANIRKLKETTGARILFPAEDEDRESGDRETIVIMGRKEDVQKAKTELESLIAELDRIVELTVNIEPKWHKHFVARRGALLKKISDEFGGVSISFPKISDRLNDKVVLKGGRDAVEAAAQRLHNIAHGLANQVTMEVAIEQIHHRHVMGARGTNVQRITQEFDVDIKFPERSANGAGSGPNQSPQQSNGDLGGSSESLEQPPVSTPAPASTSSQDSRRPKNKDTIFIHGLPDNCQRARDALLQLVPIREDVPVPFDYHRFIIGQKGRDIRELNDKFDVNISVPRAELASDVITVSGPRKAVDAAVNAIKDRVKKLDSEKADRDLRSYTAEVLVDPEYHPKIIGRGGDVINRIRSKHDVQIQMPDSKDGPGERAAARQNGGEPVEGGDPTLLEARSSAPSSRILITGYEKNAEAAKKEILDMVAEMEKMIKVVISLDQRVHPRIIGRKGQTVARLMKQFNVDVRFPTLRDSDPSKVTLMGLEEDVDACQDELKRLEEDYLDDVSVHYTIDRSKQNAANEAPAGRRSGFVVKGAPWDKRGDGKQSAPDTSNQEEFPSFSLGGATVPQASGNGPPASPRPTGGESFESQSDSTGGMSPLGMGNVASVWGKP